MRTLQQELAKKLNVTPMPVVKKVNVEVERPIPAVIARLKSSENIRFDADYLGVCIIDVYRQPGDLYESWDIVSINEDGSFSRVPDARYGVDQPPEPKLEDFQPVRLWEVYEVWDSNGWTKSDLSIYSDDGHLICHKANG